MSVQSTKPQGRHVSQSFHDWLLGEDSALRSFLPPTLSACSPRADASAVPGSPCLAAAEAPILIPRGRRSGKTLAAKQWLEGLPSDSRIYYASLGKIVSPAEALTHLTNLGFNMSNAIPATHAELVALIDERINLLTGVPASDRGGLVLNAQGAYQLGNDTEKRWIFSYDGWDAATTNEQRANLRVQLGLDESGMEKPAGFGIHGFGSGPVSAAMYPLFADMGPDGLGGRLWAPIDGHGVQRADGQLWAYPRIRVRLRGEEAILAAIAASEAPPRDP